MAIWGVIISRLTGPKIMIFNKCLVIGEVYIIANFYLFSKIWRKNILLRAIRQYISFHFDFQPHINFRIQAYANVSNFFSLVSSRLIFSTWYMSFSSQPFSKNSGASWFTALNVFGSFNRISSTTFLIITWFSCLFWDILLGMGLLLRSLVGRDA